MTLRVSLLLVPAVVGISRLDSDAMIGRVVRTKTVHPCFCCSPPTHAHRASGAGSQQRIVSRILAAAANGREDGTSSPTFYQRLGSPKHVLAPMVAQSDLPFRLMCEQLYGVDLSYTQMIHAYNFVENGGETFRTNHLDVYPHSLVRDILAGKEDGSALIMTPSQENAVKGLSEDDIDQSRKRILAAVAKVEGGEQKLEQAKPTIVQIASHDPDVAVEAATIILERSGTTGSTGAVSPVAAIDLNLGKRAYHFVCSEHACECMK